MSRSEARDILLFRGDSERRRHLAQRMSLVEGRDCVTLKGAQIGEAADKLRGRCTAQLTGKRSAYSLWRLRDSFCFLTAARPVTDVPVLLALRDFGRAL